MALFSSARLPPALHVLARVDARLVRGRCLPELAAVQPDSLVFELGGAGVGQAVWALPIVDALLARFPGRPIEIAGAATPTALLVAHCAAKGRRTVIPATAQEPLRVTLGARPGPPRIRRAGAGWHLQLPRSGGRCVAFSPPHAHAAVRLGESGFMAGLDVAPAAPRLRVEAALNKRARTLLGQLCAERGRPLIALLPAHDPRRSCGIERLWQVGQRLVERMGGTVVQLGGPAGPPQGVTVARAGPAAPLAAALLALAAVSVSDDTGWCQVAAACDAPVAAVFGPSDPDRHGPISPRAAVLWASAQDCVGCAPQRGTRCLRCVPLQRWVDAAEQVAAAHWPRDRLRGLGIPL